MPATYSPAGHPRLSAAAQALSPEALDVYAMEAEAALGIAGTNYTGQNAEELTLAVARQVNRTLAIETRGDGAGDIKSESKGDQSYTYATKGDALLSLLDDISVAIVARVTSSIPEGENGYRSGTVSVPTEYTW